MYRYINEARSFNQPITDKNISELITQLNKTSDLTKIKGKYARVTSEEDDYVQYYDISNVAQELSSAGLSFGEVMKDPWLIIEYAESLESYGIHHAFEVEEYNEFKHEMNRKYGFSR